MLRSTLLFALCILPLCSHSQKPGVAIEMEEFNIVYRGYSNKIRVCVSNSRRREILLTSKELDIEKSDKEDIYYVRPNGFERSATIHVWLVKGRDTNLVRAINYRASNLPDPELFWGPARANSPANIREKYLFVKYTPEVPLNAAFAIKYWEITIDSIAVTGTGGNLGKAEELLKSIKTPQTLRFRVTYVGPDRITRRKEASWEVRPWDETPEPPELLIVD